MKILVTGGAGFIGSYLCNQLINNGDEVICLDNFFTSRKKNIFNLMKSDLFEYWRHDVCDPFHIECDRIYHLACPASPIHYQRNPVQTIKTATLGTLNVLELARNTGARLLISSTSEIYGDPLEHPQKESYYGNVNPVGQRSCYDEGKRIGETLAVSWINQYKTDVRIARIFNTYGPGMAFNDGRMIPNFIIQAMNNENITIYGNGMQTRSLCYISDTVNGLIKLMEYKTSNDDLLVMNLGNPDERSVLSIANDIIELINSHSIIKNYPLPDNDPKQRCPDINKAKNMLNWYPKIEYMEGLKLTVNWFKEVNNVER